MKKIAALFLAITLSFTLSSCAYTEKDIDEARQDGYDSGYELGKDEGYDQGYEEGYDEGYDIGWEESYEQAKNDFIEYSSTTTPDYSYNDEIPSTAVFVTRTGAKYHTGYCQYVQGKSDLSYYDSANEAESAGYAPCSVCY